MPSQSIKFTTWKCDASKNYIQAEPNDIYLYENSVIEFSNALDPDDDGNPSDIAIEFFMAGGSKDSTISGVCATNGTKIGDKLEVPGQDVVDCNFVPPPAKKAVYGYKVSVTDGLPHEPLDPVIIIEPQYNAFVRDAPEGPGTPLLPIIGALIVGLVLGFFVRGLFGPRGAR